MEVYTHLLFDLDDTLLDFRQASQGAFNAFYNEFLQKSGLPLEEAFQHYHDANMMVWEMFEQNQISIEDLKTRRFEWMYQQARLPVPHDQLKNQSDYFLDALIASTQLLEGAAQLLQKSSTKYHLSVITNGISYVQQSRLKRLNIGHHFNHIFISEEIGHSKPSSAFFQYVINTLQPDQSNRILVIGDSLKADIAGALKAGLDACWYNPTSQPNHSGHQPHFEIRTLQELETLLH
jgi:putative hydrolase of the HAD superfamily